MQPTKGPQLKLDRTDKCNWLSASLYHLLTNDYTDAPIPIAASCH